MYVPAWPVLSPRYVFSLDGRKDLPFPLNLNGRGTYFHMARNGIYHLFRALDFRAGDTVLAPDYHHGVEMQAIRAAGASIRFYAVNRDLEPDLDEVARLCRSNPRALYVIHFMGWPQPIDELAALCRERGIMLIEDCALALLSEPSRRPLGTFGQYAIFCLYKTLPVPNGGLLVQQEGAREDLTGLALRSCGLASGGGQSLELMLEWVRSRSHFLGEALGFPKKALGNAVNALGVKRPPAGTADLDFAHVNLGMSPLSHSLLRRFDYAQIRRRRRSNFLLMQELFDGRVALPRPELGEGVCPLFFPILVADKASTARALRQRGIGALEWWSTAPIGNGEASAGSQYLRDHLLGLPIHQDVSESQVEYTVDQVLGVHPWR
jgi:dTDP-4-amino-4,6-dideoxygalactose transaminase